MKKIGIVTGNKNKIKEINSIVKNLNLKNININMISDFDLPEPKLNWKEVLLYKAKILFETVNKLLNEKPELNYLKQDSYIVEDTIIYLKNKNTLGWKEIVDIKWLIKELKNYEGSDIKWQTSIGVIEDNKIKLYTNNIKGIVKFTNLKGFGFDPYFYLKNKKKVIAELSLEEKNKISPRTKVFEDYFLNKKPYLEIDIEKVKIDNNIKWQNNYSYKKFEEKLKNKFNIRNEEVQILNF